MTTDSLAPSELQIQHAVKAALAAVDRGDHAGALKVFKAIYDDPNINAPADGLSSYGLCLAIVENQTKKGIDLCRAAITTQFYDSRHFVNLVNLHLRKGNRSAAVETVKEALGRMPKDAAILALKEKLGIREAPPIRFLSHDNPLNRMFARGRSAGKKGPGNGLKLGGIHPVAGIIIATVFFAVVFGGTFYVLYQKAYG
jgi:hypothetical protein